MTGARNRQFESTESEVCPTFAEESRDEEWQAILPDLTTEPRCGHAISYLKSNVNATITVSTAKSYCGLLAMFVSHLHNRDVSVCQAEFSDIRDYFKKLARGNRSESTLQLHRSAIINLYKHIRYYREMDANVHWDLVLEDINPADYQTSDPIERKPLTEEEVVKLYDAMNSFRNRLIVQVAVELGPRSGAITSAKVSDLNPDENLITLQNIKSGGKITLKLPSKLGVLLHRWVEVERNAQTGGDDNGVLFPRKWQGGKLTSGRVGNIVRDAADRAGIQEEIGSPIPLSENQKSVKGFGDEPQQMHKVTPHALRHTYNHLLEKAGVPREARSAALAHSSVEITKKHYEHNEEEYREVIHRLFDGIDDKQD